MKRDGGIHERIIESIVYGEEDRNEGAETKEETREKGDERG